MELRSPARLRARPALIGTTAAVALAAALGPGPAQAQVGPPAITERSSGIEAYVDASQFLDIDELFDGNLRSSTGIGGGVNGFIRRERVQGTLGYRLTYRFPITGRGSGRLSHNLTARGSTELLRDTVFVNAGAYASLFARDLSSLVSFSDEDNNNNFSQTYSAFVEPSFRQDIGDAFDFNARYRLSYVNVDNSIGSLGDTGGFDPLALQSAGNSVVQEASAVLGNQERGQRLRWDLIGSWRNQDNEFLDGRFLTYSGTLNLEYALGRSFALLGSGGYTSYRSTEQGFLVGPDGFPVLTPEGGYIPDPTAPRRVGYDEDGLVWNAGFRWTPSPRTLLSIRAGQRFDDLTVTGQLRYAIRPDLVLTGQVTDGIETFASILTQVIDGVPTSFVLGSTRGFGAFGCVFGIDPGTSRCIDDAVQSVSRGVFRSRIATLTLDAGSNERMRYALSFTYNNRRFLDTQATLSPFELPVDPTLVDRDDNTMTLTARASRSLDRSQSISASAFATRYDLGLRRDRQDYYAGLRGAYNVDIDRNISANASLYAAQRFGSGTARDDFNATFRVGAQYRF